MGTEAQAPVTATDAVENEPSSLARACIGPWRWDGGALVDAKGCRVLYGDDEGAWARDDEAERLIASAPDLLAELTFERDQRQALEAERAVMRDLLDRLVLRTLGVRPAETIAAYPTPVNALDGLAREALALLGRAQP